MIWSATEDSNVSLKIPEQFVPKKKEQYCEVNIEVHTIKCSDQSGPIAAIGVGNCKMLLNPFAVSDGPYAAKWGMEWILSSADLVFFALWECSVHVLIICLAN